MSFSHATRSSNKQIRDALLIEAARASLIERVRGKFRDYLKLFASPHQRVVRLWCSASRSWSQHLCARQGATCQFPFHSYHSFDLSDNLRSDRTFLAGRTHSRIRCVGPSPRLDHRARYNAAGSCCLPATRSHFSRDLEVPRDRTCPYGRIHNSAPSSSRPTVPKQEGKAVC